MKKLMMVLAIVAVFGLGVAQADILGPYDGTDPNTIHLWHCDGAESTTAALDSVGSLDLDNLANGATVGITAGETGFGECHDVNVSGGYSGYMNNTSTTVAVALGSTDGAFTAEGITKWNGYNDTLCTARFGNSNLRVLVYPGSNFVLVDIGGDSQITLNDGVTYDRNFPIPHPESNKWYHWAVTYNGLEDTPDNVKVYWTPLEESYTEAQLMDSRRAKLDQGSASGPFGTAYRLCGWADEMRISNIVRAADDMMFGTAVVVPEPAGLGLIGLALLAVRRKRS